MYCKLNKIIMKIIMKISQIDYENNHENEKKEFNWKPLGSPVKNENLLTTIILLKFNWNSLYQYLTGHSNSYSVLS